MVSNIPPIGPNIPPSSPGKAEEPNGQADTTKLAQELLNLENELHSYLGPPLDIKALERFLPKLKEFLEENKKAIYSALEKKGWPIGGPFSISSEFDSAISAINAFMEKPNPGSADMVNESLTTINTLFAGGPIFPVNG